MDERLREAIEHLNICFKTGTLQGFWVDEDAKDRQQAAFTTIVKAATERDTLAKALEVAVKALQFYQDVKNYQPQHYGEAMYQAAVKSDEGEKATKALSEIERIKGEKS